MLWGPTVVECMYEWIDFIWKECGCSGYQHTCLQFEFPQIIDISEEIAEKAIKRIGIIGWEMMLCLQMQSLWDYSCIILQHFRIH